MFNALFQKFEMMFTGSDHQDHEDYLASSVDFADFERRMRYLEAGHLPFGEIGAGAPRERNL